MTGAIIGDIAGSRFEFHNYRKKDFDIFGKGVCFTDDTLMTLAVANALIDFRDDPSKPLPGLAVYYMREFGNEYPHAGFGGRFFHWLRSDNPEPYGSFGNGSAMRVSPCGWVGETVDEVKELSRAVTAVTHDHPEGIKGAEAIAVCVFMARTGFDKDSIRHVVERDYYPLDFTVDGIRPTYEFSEICQDSVPQAIEVFLESESFEDCVRTGVSIGGDCDTVAAMAGSIAEPFYGVPAALRAGAMERLDGWMKILVDDFEKRFGRGTVK